MTSLAVILYEDQRGPDSRFSFHHLVLACIADELEKDIFALRLRELLDDRPLKGVNKILAGCRSELRRIAPKGQRVFALIDNDRIRDHLKHEGVPRDASEDAVIRAIKAPDKCAAPEQLEVILLKENMESVIKAAALCDEHLPKDQVRQALQKDRAARDALFDMVVWSRGRAVRDCIRRNVPALDRLVAALCSVLAGSSGA